MQLTGCETSLECVINLHQGACHGAPVLILGRPGRVLHVLARLNGSSDLGFAPRIVPERD